MECGVNDESIVALFWNRDESAVAEAQKEYGAYCRYIAENVLGDERDAEERVVPGARVAFFVRHDAGREDAADADDAEGVLDLLFHMDCLLVS